MEARLARGMRSKRGKVASTCPRGEGSWGMVCSSSVVEERKGMEKGILGSLASLGTTRYQEIPMYQTPAIHHMKRRRTTMRCTLPDMSFKNK